MMDTITLDGEAAGVAALVSTANLYAAMINKGVLTLDEATNLIRQVAHEIGGGNSASHERCVAAIRSVFPSIQI